MPTESHAPPDQSSTLTKLSPDVQQALASLQEFAARAAEAARPVLAVAAHAAGSLAPLQGVLNEIATALRPVLESGWLESLQRGLQEAETAIRNAEDIGRMGWTFPSNACLRDCVNLLREVRTSPEATDAAFERFYVGNKRESLLLLLADLRQHRRLKEFGPLLEEVAFGLDHEKYRLVVTALIPLFEGVARRCWVDGFWKDADRKQFFGNKIVSADPDSFDRIVWSGTQAFVERLYERNFDDDPKPLGLNRHWISHGRGPADASLVDALRLLQAIHTVVSLADEEAEEAARAAQVAG